MNPREFIITHSSAIFVIRVLTCPLIYPIITKNSTNINIRKVHIDRFDSKKAALVGLKSDLKVSLTPSGLALNCHNLCREYYDLMDDRSAYMNKLQGELRMAFPQNLAIFPRLQSIHLLHYWKLIHHQLLFLKRTGKRLLTPLNLLLALDFIRKYDEEITSVLNAMHELVDTNENTGFVKLIHLVETFKGTGFLSAMSLMGEICDFGGFSKPKQLLLILVLIQQ